MTAKESSSSGSLPSISVLVPVLNEAAHLRDVVPRMLAQRYDGELEALFIDGGSTDESRSILEAFAREDGRVRVLDNPAKFTPSALNIGLRAARGELIARMDAHTRYPSDYLAIGATRIARGDVVSVSGPAIATGSGTWSRRVALALSTPVGVGGATFRALHAEEVEVDTGFCGVWRRETLIATGGWDEEWINDQDFELASRLRADGGRIVCVPEMAAEFIVRNSLQSLAKQYWRYGQYRIKTARRHPSSLRPSHVVPPALAATVIAAVAAPWPFRRLARIGLVAYAAALTRPTIQARRSEEHRADARFLPLVFGTMHLSYGFGAFWGMARFGVPVASAVDLMRRLTGRGRASTHEPSASRSAA